LANFLGILAHCAVVQLVETMRYNR